MDNPSNFLFPNELKTLAKTAYGKYDQLITNIIDTNITDTVYIDYIFSMLIDFCYDVDMRFLFRLLIKYYLNVNNNNVEKIISNYNEKCEYPLYPLPIPQNNLS